MRPLCVFALLCTLLAPATAFAAGARPEDHAPIGVMGDHLHHRGEWMLSFRTAFMDMHGNRDGTSNVSASEVLADFPVTPTEMRMAMYVFGFMYAPTDRVTLMAMAPFVRLDMDHVNAMANTFTTSSEGIGDVTLTALIGLDAREDQTLILNAGLSLPTGSIDRADDTPLGRQRLPYPMQLGSGTFDLLPGLTFTRRTGWGSFGAQTKATLRLGENSNDYRLGPRIMATTWAAYRVAAAASLSLRLLGESWGNISGADPRLNPALVPTADPDRRAGQRVDVGFGLNLIAPRGPLAGHRLGVEFLVPVYQDLDGPQLETDWRLVLGWQKAF